MICGKNAIYSLLVFLLLLSAAPHGWAQENEFEAGTFLSNYIWRGLRLSEGPVYQTSFTLAKRGFSFNTWGNYDFHEKRLNEVDLTFAYSRETKRADFEAGLIHYGMIDGHDTDELYATVTGNAPLSPSLTAYFDVNFGKGAVLQASVEHSLKVASRASLDLQATVAAVIHDGFMGVPDSGKEFAGLHDVEFLASLPIGLTPKWSLRMRVGVTVPLSQNARQAIRNASIWTSDENSFSTTFLYGGATLCYAF
jgi:hypothetical protein